MAKIKGTTTKKSATKTEKPSNKNVEVLYANLTTLLKKNKISKRDVASKLGMSYQGFLNSFNNRNLKLEAWFEISELVNIPFVARFESARQAARAEAAASPVVQEMGGDDFTSMKLKNAEEKVAILEKQVNSLESQIQDKQTIIDLIRKV